MVRPLLCTRTKACSNSSSMMVMLTNKTAQMHLCKNLWKKLQAPCHSKTPPMNLLLLCQQHSRKWMEVRLSNHLLKPKRNLLPLNLQPPRKKLLKLLLNRLKRTIQASKPNRTLPRPNKNSQLSPLTRSKKKLSLAQKLQLLSNEKNYLRADGIKFKSFTL